MRRRKGKENLPEENVLKIDKDCHVDSQLEQEYVQNAVAILAKHGLRVEWIKATRTHHGRHYYIRMGASVNASTANQLQYLLGDDPQRFAYNQARIKSRMPEWNKLFESYGTRSRQLTPKRVNSNRSLFRVCVGMLVRAGEFEPSSVIAS
jgi:hypothetical protein